VPCPAQENALIEERPAAVAGDAKPITAAARAMTFELDAMGLFPICAGDRIGSPSS
jgi:hypothetical protein